jgi:Ni/Fe-hydrogenase subunit HybB-like protein
MTIFAVMTAGMMIMSHTGRVWLAAFWLFPYPNQRQLWPNFRSPLEWDVFAVSTYFTISLIFWYTGLIPDIASVRDRAKNKIRKTALTILSLGWRGSNKQWLHYEQAYLIFAGLSTPLVLSVHSVVSFDFAVSQVPGWHTTIFPPYFVAGAIFSGFAMVVTLLVLVREAFGLKHYITMEHLEQMNKIIMTTGMLVGYAYASEFFIAWYSGSTFERFTFVNRAFGPYWWAYWIMVSCNVFIPQIFWFRKFRRSIPIMFVVSLYVNIGMYFERFVIIVTSLHRDFLPSSWAQYVPTWVEWGIFFGFLGFFFIFFLLFVRFLPAIAMGEVKSVMDQPGRPNKGGAHA